MADISLAAKSSSPSTNINNLSDDLLAEIFKCLPFRSTAGCKHVSKRWLSLISSPYFQRQFITHRHSLYKAFLTFLLSPYESMLVFPPFPPSSDIAQNKVPVYRDVFFTANELYSCSNGLFLCCYYTTSTGGYYVYNMLTEECTRVPPSPATYEGGIYTEGFVCRPHGTFHVVIIRPFVEISYEFELGVYSSETGMWKQVLMTCPEGFSFGSPWPLRFAYDGSLYFLGKTGIFVYDPYTLQGYTLDYPHGADAVNIMKGFLWISCGCLRIADIKHNDLKVWELIDNDYQHWQLLYRINLLSTKLPQKFCSNCYKKVVGFHPYDGDIVYLHSYEDGLFVADLGANRFEAIPGYEKAYIIPFQIELSSSIAIRLLNG